MAKSKEYTFLGYTIDQKGYRCLDVEAMMITVSRDVVFNEISFPFFDLLSRNKSKQSSDNKFTGFLTFNVQCVPSPITTRVVISISQNGHEGQYSSNAQLHLFEHSFDSENSVGVSELIAIHDSAFAFGFENPAINPLVSQSSTENNTQVMGVVENIYGSENLVLSNTQQITNNNSVSKNSSFDNNTNVTNLRRFDSIKLHPPNMLKIMIVVLLLCLTIYASLNIFKKLLNRNARDKL